jgi:hypothetical protein
MVRFSYFGLKYIGGVENENFITIGKAKVGLIGLLTDPNGINTELQILNEFNQKLGFLNLFIKFEEPEAAQRLLKVGEGRETFKMDKMDKIHNSPIVYKQKKQIDQNRYSMNEFERESKEMAKPREDLIKKDLFKHIPENDQPQNLVNTMDRIPDSQYPLVSFDFTVESGIRIKNPLNRKYYLNVY